jgi:hypothetical protein
MHQKSDISLSLTNMVATYLDSLTSRVKDLDKAFAHGEETPEALGDDFECVIAIEINWQVRESRKIVAGHANWIAIFCLAEGVTLKRETFGQTRMIELFCIL